MHKYQKGFGVVKVIIITAIISIIGFTGWLPQTPVENSTAQAQKSTLPEGWKKYENKNLGFSFAYPEQ